MTRPRVIYWFRTDLRLHDSPALKAALDLDAEAFWPVWTWDPHYVYRARVGVNRWQFLLDCQNDISRAITQCNPKSKLFLLREAPQTLFPKLFRAWKVTHLVFEKDTDAYARDRDAAVMAACREAGVEVVVRAGRTLWDSDELVRANGNKPTMSLTQVEHAGERLGEVVRPIPAPKTLPDPGETELDFAQQPPEQRPDVNSAAREGDDRSYKSIAGPKGDFAVPTLEELGFPPATTKHRGGESVALDLLDKVIANEDYTATFEKPKTAPTGFEPQGTTLLSPYLHFGALSCREFYWRVRDVVDNYKGTASKPPVSLTGQLMFRDMYFGAQAKLGHAFAQTYGNSHCRFIPWHLMPRIDPKTKLLSGGYHVDSPQAEEWFQRWKFGRTGFPWIDALMRQLRAEGWIHHLGRHAVACFLTRGGCYISWERGAEVFEEWLIDHETACNVGNWQWLSCTAFFAQYYRCYSPIAFPQKWDKEGRFIRRYVPELARLDKKYIYEPWKAPLVDQKKAGVRVTGDGPSGTDRGDAGDGTYPKPMFDFAERRTICIDGMKQAYDVGLYGNNAKVLDGSWSELFADDGEGPTEGSNFSVTLRKIETDDGARADEHSEDDDAHGGGHDAKGQDESKAAAMDRKSVRKAPRKKHSEEEEEDNDDGATSEDEMEAAETGGETKGGDEGAKAEAEVKTAAARRGKATTPKPPGGKGTGGRGKKSTARQDADEDGEKVEPKAEENDESDDQKDDAPAEPHTKTTSRSSTRAKPSSSAMTSTSSPASKRTSKQGPLDRHVKRVKKSAS